MPTTAADIRRAVAGHRPSHVPLGGLMPHAAVAAVVRDSSVGAELLLIRRAEHPTDPWSGHMAFPGGRVDPRDADPLATALRETREEISLDLAARAQLVGPLSQLAAKAHARPIPMVIAPFVFELHGGATEHDPPFELNHEVQEVVWVPVDFFRDRGNRGTMPWKVAGITLEMSCYRWTGRVIWGLTLRMIDELVGILP